MLVVNNYYSVLQQTLTLVDRAKALSPQRYSNHYIVKILLVCNTFSAEYCTEYGYQQMMMGNLKGAISSFRNALKIDEGCEKALNGEHKALG